MHALGSGYVLLNSGLAGLGFALRPRLLDYNFKLTSRYSSGCKVKGSIGPKVIPPIHEYS